MNEIWRHLTSPQSLIKAIKDPRAAYDFLVSHKYENEYPHEKRRELQSEFDKENWVSSLARLLNAKPAEIEQYILEYKSEVAPHVEDCEQVFDNKPFMMGGVEIEAPILYSSIRHISPRNIVEVGVANGVSSYYILSALERNSNDGNLTSVDIPKYESDHTGEWGDSAGAWIPKGKDVGWIVPQKYESNWDLHIGDMDNHIPDIITRKDGIDAYIYDGPKGYKTRKRALNYIFEMGDGCLLFCDDIAWNRSFEDFANEEELEWETYGNIGLALY